MGVPHGGRVGWWRRIARHITPASRKAVLNHDDSIGQARHDIDTGDSRVSYLEIEVLERLDRLERQPPAGAALAVALERLTHIEAALERLNLDRDARLAELVDIIRESSRAVADKANEVLKEF